MITNILQYFEKTCKNYPDKIVVKDGNFTITMQDLAKGAWSIGTFLLQQGVGARKPVGVFLIKSIACIEADIGIIYSGNAFMNLDIKTPLQRIANILAAVQPAAIITDVKGREQLLSIKYADEKIFLVEDMVAIPGNHDTLLKNLEQLVDTDPLCIVNTSGSIGTPKSVVLNHKSYIDFTEWALATMNWTEEERFGSLSPAVFDIYIVELCMLMAKGACLVLINPIFAAFPAKLLQLLIQEKITFIFWVPTGMVNIANMGLLVKFSFPDLKTVCFGGEVFSTKQFNMWRRALPHTKFINMYGPTEVACGCTYYVVDREIQDSEPIPIGYPCRNTDILLLNESDELVRDGEEGELCVRGTSLAMGYYNNPEKTRVAFVQNPLNKFYHELIYRTGDMAVKNSYGELVFRGRKDNLIKCSGYRIELTEIEHVIINSLQLVQNGCAVFNPSKKEIVFFYEAEQELSVAELRKRIGSVLPSYMVPTKYVRQEFLPRNINGKIDRQKLKESLD